MCIFLSRHERNVNFRRLFLWPIITVIKKALETYRELWLKYSLTCSIINAELKCYMKCLRKIMVSFFSKRSQRNCITGMPSSTAVFQLILLSPWKADFSGTLKLLLKLSFISVWVGYVLISIGICFQVFVHILDES